MIHPYKSLLNRYNKGFRFLCHGGFPHVENLLPSIPATSIIHTTSVIPAKAGIQRSAADAHP